MIALLPTAEASRPADLPAEATNENRYPAGSSETGIIGRTRPSATPLRSWHGSARDTQARARVVSLDHRVTPSFAPGVVAGRKPEAFEPLALPRTNVAFVMTTLGAAPGGANAAIAPSGEDVTFPSFAVAPEGVNDRLTGSVWVLARGGDAAAVATNGLLGGSQAGARLLYRLVSAATQPLSISARLSGPLRRKGAEAALGLEWQPVARAPVRILAERRQRVAGEGRSAFALLAHGGVSDRPVAGLLRLDAYAHAGVVGARSRDLFADGGLTLVRPLEVGRPQGPAVGAGMWGGAQPGASRLDVGPRLTTTLGAAPLRARVSLDWRFRVAGDAAPSSGPSLTIGADF